MNWYKNPKITVPALIACIGLMITFVKLYFDFSSRPSDFSIDISRPLVEVSRGSHIDRNIFVKNSWNFKKSLRLEAKSDVEGVKVEFDPISSLVPFVSKMKVYVGENAPIGNCNVTIKGVGPDKKEHSIDCKFFIKENSNNRLKESGKALVKFISPVDGSKVKHRGQSIEVKIKNLPKEDKLWLVIYPPLSKTFYPQDNPAQEDGEWTYFADFGRAQDKGVKFYIIAVQVDKTSCNIFKSYIDYSRESGNWLGLKKLPPGCVRCGKIGVTRR